MVLLEGNESTRSPTLVSQRPYSREMSPREVQPWFLRGPIPREIQPWFLRGPFPREIQPWFLRGPFPREDQPWFLGDAGKPTKSHDLVVKLRKELTCRPCLCLEIH
ncbi:hypothetical protein SUGI_0538180 [Cryptomeria japonica]|uniref:uncharacterized protein LOC131040738 isoform X1 n=1 Tax=Cryptomeria japonica TaxID=3369 RepID=UPI002408A8E5|nr:uncharacterized protein LOC131040738 isoform X1 [Cryptomeria japonica]GLJ27414.1 hypothetical protein SUGI_0538180 [Cryptomeria japonica]